MTPLYLLTAIFFLLQLGDWYTTRTIIAKGGTELNPIDAAVFKVLGLDATMALKTIILTVVGYLAGLQYLALLAAFVVYYTYVVVHNWKQIK